MTVDIWIRDYNPPRRFQKKISGRSTHNAALTIYRCHVFVKHTMTVGKFGTLPKKMYTVLHIVYEILSTEKSD
jgi:hypothetical protein